MNYLDIIIPFVGGLALFIYGMQIMAQGLQNAAGNKMKQLLKALTQNKIMGVLLGAIVTAIIQSSSATTIMVVGFVNAGLMDLTQSMSVIVGANIGTTVTGWLVSSVEWAKFLSPAVIAPVVVMIGVILMITAKNISHKEISSIVIGFGILFIGIEMMSDAVYPLRESEIFKTLFMTSNFRYFDRCSCNSNYTEFFCFCWYTANIGSFWISTISCSRLYHYGTKYRNLYYSNAFCDRCKS